MFIVKKGENPERYELWNLDTTPVLWGHREVKENLIVFENK